MSSTRSLGLVMLAVGAMMLGGCQEAKEKTDAQVKAFHLQKDVPPSEVLNEAPIAGDPALDVRQWEPSAAIYVNDAVVAGPTYTPLEVGQMDYWLNAPVEQLLFLGNFFYLPVGVFIQPPWSNVVYKSFTAKPSYTLMPPLPDGPQQMPSYTYY